MPTHLIGSDAFQECDTVGITRSCTKHNYLVRDVNDLSRVIHEAFYVATTGRPGPVLVDIPKNIQFQPRHLCGPSRAVHHQHLRSPRTERDLGPLDRARRGDDGERLSVRSSIRAAAS